MEFHLRMQSFTFEDCKGIFIGTWSYFGRILTIMSQHLHTDSAEGDVERREFINFINMMFMISPFLSLLEGVAEFMVFGVSQRLPTPP